MRQPNICTSKKVVPMIYAYSTPEIKRHIGWTKIGYTEQNVEERIKQQTHTADVEWKLEWKGRAVFDDGSEELFRDTDFHAYLKKRKFQQESGKNNEWFKIDGSQSQQEFHCFRANHGILQSTQSVVPYTLRQEQNDAVQKTIDYKHKNPNGEFLWNAKPRFGKTLSVYDFAKRIFAERVLVVTNRPAVANSWLSDYNKFLGVQSGYYFISDVDSLKGKEGVLTYAQYKNSIMNNDDEQITKFIRFVSLQDLKGSIYFGGTQNKLNDIVNNKWDLLVVDEAHEGVDTYKTDVAFNQIKRSFTLHLSGTPFKALANDKFSNDAIFNWTYADEQKKKRDWDDVEKENPYENLPKLNLFTYQISDMMFDELSKGKNIDEDFVMYSFDLNEFFATDQKGKFKYSATVDKFLDAMVTGEKFPFSTPELRDELRHTFWLLDRVDSAKALAKKLQEHPVFKDYQIVLAAGDGKLDEQEANQKSYDKVLDAIENYEKTITLSVGQLTTGVTIPQWTGVMMLSNIKSASLYMQAAFRVQNPWKFNLYNEIRRKTNAYIFDFDPARTLTVFEEFANDLSVYTSAGKGDTEQRKKNIKELLNFFPVIGEDANGELIELDAEKVLSIPRKLRSVEVVRCGFINNYLFQNISNIFAAPKAVIDIIEKFNPVDKSDLNSKAINRDDLSLNEDGEVEVSDEYIIGKSADIFGDKIFVMIENTVETAVSEADAKSHDEKQYVKNWKNMVDKVTGGIVEATKKYYGDDMKKSDQNRIESDIKKESDKLIGSLVGDYTIKKNTVEQQRKDELTARFETGRSTDEIEAEYNQKIADISKEIEKNLKEEFANFASNSTKNAVDTLETNKKKREKKSIEDDVRDHLRGFTRTIPSFLMAYGDASVNLETFDRVIPDKVFKEVTSITLEQFRFLRDGGTYIDENNGEEKWFEGQLFDQVVFDDSIKEFLALKKRLANYFDEQSSEDIFDYIPPQKTNQIFTPKNMVKKMVDLLENENPGCFDTPNKTFIDLYMKSGLYITEIVKRLYNSAKIKELYPDDTERLKHIFEKQVFGLAPTEIIYKIATNFILGFDEDVKITKHNFKQLDALPYAKEGTLCQILNEVFDESIVENV